MVVIQTTPELLQLFRERRIYHQVARGERWKESSRLGVMRDCRLEPYSHVHVGYYIPARLGAFSYAHSILRAELRIGRYCSIGEEVRFMGDRHPMEWASSSPAFYSRAPLQGARAYFSDRGLPEGDRRAYGQPDPSIHIGHDVWIADEAMIARGVTIGDGAVVAARSLVLDDVPPYAVVVGSPARVLRLRYPEPLIERMLKVQWWRFEPAVLDGLPIEDPERFLDALEADPPAIFEPAPVTFEEIAAVAPIVTETG